MTQRLDYLKQRDTDWLLGSDFQQLIPLTEQLYLELSQRKQQGIVPKVLIAERESVKFIAGFIAATAANCPVFLSNPNWVKQEWQQVFKIVQPDLVLGYGNWDLEIKNYYPNQPFVNDNWVMIPTGGSSGEIRFAIHTWETLSASVAGFQQYFELKNINSFCTLPLYHVSGIMQFMRSFITNGKLVIYPSKQLENSCCYETEISDFFISVVPTQLQRLLEKPDTAKWLAKFKTVLLGGAPAWQELLDKARKYKINLALTYGMTETASGIAILKPKDFFNGENNCGEVLPHTQVSICNDKGKKINQNEVGNIVINSQSLALGYYPNLFKNRDSFRLDDLGFIDAKGYLNLVGRSSNKIITGGENVYPIEVEAAIRNTNLVNDVCVIGTCDRIWGQAVTAIYIKKDSTVSTNKLQAAIADKLSKYKQPKYWIDVDNIPRNLQGKINYKQLNAIAEKHLNIKLKL